MSYRLLRRFPTMAGRSVHLAETRDGRQVVLKRALDPAAAATLAASVRQLRALAPVAGCYPPVLGFTGDTLVLPYYRRGTLDSAATGAPADFRRLVAGAVGCLFEVSARRTFPGDPAEAVPAARRFWREQLCRRLDRLAGTGSDVAREPFAAIAVALADGSLDRLLDRAVSRPLGLAAHGDFGLHNVLLAGPDDDESDGTGSDGTGSDGTGSDGTGSDGARYRFIDLRGQTWWAGGLPWWDPVLDLATLIAFHTLVEPALGVRDGIASRPVPGLVTLSRDELLADAEAQPAVRAWTADDPGWRLRTRLGVVTRLLGSVSDQLSTAPGDRRARAGVLTDLLAHEWKVLLSC